VNVEQVDLRTLFNARAATYDYERHRGGFNAWGNSFPAEELPFDKKALVGGVPFSLARSGEGDHLEAAGQVLDLPRPVEASTLALLAFGEMGAQCIAVIAGGSHSCDVLNAFVPGWLVDGSSPVRGGLACTHLHYPGGYELAQLRPVMWLCSLELPQRSEIAQLAFGANPLFHIAAATLLT
jgi:hypothetical protein